jgi:hypothetical protein
MSPNIFASLVLIAAALCAAPGASAAPPEQAYLAARDHAIAVLKQKSGDKQVAEDKRLRAGLEAQLKSLIGPLRLEGFSGEATMSPESLLVDDIGSGALDGISVAAAKENAGSALVTTDGLMQHWLNAHKDWWKKEANPPTGAESAFHSEAFYTQAVSTDAAVSIFAPLPIRKPDGAGVAVALLVQQSQDLAIDPPSEIAVAVTKGPKVFIAIVNAETKTAPIAACDAVWQGFKAKSDAAQKKYQDSGLKDERSFNESTLLEDDGAKALHKCWSEQASRAPEFPALVKQAQALADLFASQ